MITRTKVVCAYILRFLASLARQMKQEMTRSCEDHEHATARYLQLKRNAEEGTTQVKKNWVLFFLWSSCIHLYVHLCDANHAGLYPALI